MKKLLFILLFLPAYLWGQSEFYKIQIGASFSPDYDYRTLKSTGKENEKITAKGTVDLRNDYEVGKFGYTTGISAIYNFSALFGIELGVQFSEKGYQTKVTKPTPMEKNDPAIPTNGWNFIYKYEYIDIPLKANFTFGKSRLRYIATAGFAANFLIEEKETTVMKFSEKTKKETYIRTSPYNNKFNISPVIGAGVEYNITNKISIRAIPNFKYGLMKIYDNPYMTTHLWNAGIDIGIFYGIK